MVRRSERSKKRVSYRSPGGKLRTRTKREKMNAPKCAVCGVKLKGTASNPRKVRKTERRPERIFGGNLCHKCAERVVMYRARVKNGDMKGMDVPLVFQQYL